MYLEKYESLDGDHSQDAQEYTRSLAQSALELTKLAQFVHRDAPSVIT